MQGMHNWAWRLGMSKSKVHSKKANAAIRLLRVVPKKQRDERISSGVRIEVGAFKIAVEDRFDREVLRGVVDILRAVVGGGP